MGRLSTPSATPCASLLFEGGKNVKQVQEWLGHHDAGFTLKTYVHLIDDGLGGADFLDEDVKPAAVRVPAVRPLASALADRSQLLRFGAAALDEPLKPRFPASRRPSRNTTWH